MICKQKSERSPPSVISQQRTILYFHRPHTHPRPLTRPPPRGRNPPPLSLPSPLLPPVLVPTVEVLLQRQERKKRRRSRRRRKLLRNLWSKPLLVHHSFCAENICCIPFIIHLYTLGGKVTKGYIPICALDVQIIGYALTEVQTEVQTKPKRKGKAFYLKPANGCELNTEKLFSFKASLT